jgi:FkbM family methyltransferase
MHTLLMAGWVGPEGRVLAYEPNPDVLGFLEANVALNWVGDRVTVRRVGVSEAPGRTTLYVTERFQGNSSLLKPGEEYFANVPMDTVREVEIEVVTLDDDAEQLGQIDLVKIDVEGAECSVLKGMTRLLDTGAVDRVCFEVYRDRMGDAWSEFGELLTARARDGWRFFEIAEDGDLISLEVERLLEVGRYSQVVMSKGDA